MTNANLGFLNCQLNSGNKMKLQVSTTAVRNLLKLASSWAEHRNEELSTVHFDKAVKFLPKTRNEAIKEVK